VFAVPGSRRRPNDELTLRAKAKAARICKVGSGISAASRDRAVWKDDKAMLNWVNTL
jgi:hypothetical protein